MASFRCSTARERNARVTAWSERPRSLLGEAEELAGDTSIDGTLVLVGGCDLTHFRLRVAQSHVRTDMAPSLWSHVGILCVDRGGPVLFEVALDPEHGFRDVPRTNGVRRASVERYEEDAARYPNLALLRFPVPRTLVAGSAESGAATFLGIRDGIERVRGERGVLDIPRHILPWLGFVWGAGTPGNPLVDGVGIPSAVFAEASFAALGVELTPGLSTQASCPEAIWQAARWWHPYYQDDAAAVDASAHAGPVDPAREQPIGRCWIGQGAATFVEQDRA